MALEQTGRDGGKWRTGNDGGNCAAKYIPTATYLHIHTGILVHPWWDQTRRKPLERENRASRKTKKKK